MLRQIGATELLLILGVALLFFGGRRLPEMARGSGQALRIFKDEIRTQSSKDESESEPAQTKV